jgi:hypothetical protein
LLIREGMDIPDTRPASYIQYFLLWSICRLRIEELGKWSEVIHIALGELDSMVLSIQSSKFSVVWYKLGSRPKTYRQGADISSCPVQDEREAYNIMIIGGLEGPAAVFSVTYY